METCNPHRTTQQLPRGTIMKCVCVSVWLLEVLTENPDRLLERNWRLALQSKFSVFPLLSRWAPTPTLYHCAITIKSSMFKYHCHPLSPNNIWCFMGFHSERQESSGPQNTHRKALRVWRVHRDDVRKSDSLVWPLRQQCLETAGIACLMQ